MFVPLLLPVFAAVADEAEKEIASLEEAKTIEEISSYVKQTLVQTPAEKVEKTLQNATVNKFNESNFESYFNKNTNH
jgi:hypothetical protein